MIKVTIEEILNAIPALKMLKEQPVNGIIAFKIARILREVNKEVELFEQERQKLIEAFCYRDENGRPIIKDNNIKIDPKFINEFNNKIKEMLTNEIEINATQLPLNILENVTLTAEQVFSLEKFFEE